ncbi:unannotated protein [freshwater metagenome]|uniref:Unannotated protein n=1 Tax=freshwater metagenome TaxID=449393 RepID=A0A6J6U0V2_9ZZZZ
MGLRLPLTRGKSSRSGKSHTCRPRFVGPDGGRLGGDHESRRTNPAIPTRVRACPGACASTHPDRRRGAHRRHRGVRRRSGCSPHGGAPRGDDHPRGASGRVRRDVRIPRITRGFRPKRNCPRGSALRRGGAVDLRCDLGPTPATCRRHCARGGRSLRGHPCSARRAARDAGEHRALHVLRAVRFRCGEGSSVRGPAPRLCGHGGVHRGHARGRSAPSAASCASASEGNGRAERDRWA